MKVRKFTHPSIFLATYLLGLIWNLANIYIFLINLKIWKRRPLFFLIKNWVLLKGNYQTKKQTWVGGYLLLMHNFVLILIQPSFNGNDDLHALIAMSKKMVFECTIMMSSFVCTKLPPSLPPAPPPPQVP